jgi:prefoldin alpha subunit
MSASTVAATNPSERQIDPMSLSLDQLNNLKTQNEEELQELQRQLEALHNAKGRFLNARNNLDDMSTSKKDDVLLVPLNSSLYVPGRICDPERVS